MMSDTDLKITKGLKLFVNSCCQDTGTDWPGQNMIGDLGEIANTS